MLKQFTVYNPVTLKKHIFNFNELRLWLDMKTLIQTIDTTKKNKLMFDALDPYQKESFLKFTDRHEEKIKFKINTWNGIPGLTLTFFLDIRYAPDTEIFMDDIKQFMLDNFFYDKKICTLPQEGTVIVNDKTFPIKGIWGISEDFCYTENLQEDDLLPVFDRYIGSGSSEGDRIILLNQESNVSPVQIKIPFYKEFEWLYELTLVVENVIDWKNVLWPNIPNIKQIYEFFYKEGFVTKGDGNKRIVWEREGDVVEFYKTSPYFYLPFIIVKKYEDKMDVYSRTELGMKLINEMNRTGLLEEINLFQGNSLLADALDKLTTKNKKTADTQLINAEEFFAKCNSYLWGSAQLQIVFCEWLKTRIADYYGDYPYKKRSNIRLLDTLKNIRTWDAICWYLNYISKEKDYPVEIIQELLPISSLDKEYFIKPSTYKELLELWEKSLTRDKCPQGMSISEWHYLRAKEAYDISLNDIALKKLKLFFKEAVKDPEKTIWAEKGTEELLDFSIKVGADKYYFKFVQSMSSYFSKVRKEQSIGDMSAIGRKNYRWDLFNWCVAEARWAFHSGYLLSKSDKYDKDEVNKWFIQSHEAFDTAMLYYDETENYNFEQIKIIAHAFITAYNIGFHLKDYNMIDYSYGLLKNLWNRNYSSELYKIIHGVFIKEEREEMADFLIEQWIQRTKEVEGDFVLDIKKTLELSNLYISVEEWEEAAQTLNYGLTNFSWDYYSLNKAYEIFKTLYNYSPEFAPICEESIFYWIDVYKKETEDIINLLPNTINDIKRIGSV